MEIRMDEQEKRRYDAWIHSPTVSSSDPQEMIIAFKISRLLKLVPSKVLKALRGREGVDTQTISLVEAFVESEADLTYVQSAPNRLVILTEVPPSNGVS
jgi:hypothetical protein